MIGKNTEKLYVLPDITPHRAGTEITGDELTGLISLSGELMDESVRNLFAERMQTHVGPEATYALKASVLQGLKVIYDKLKDSETSESEQKILAMKLQERAEQCSPGFHNGVNAIVDGFYLAKSIDDLLYRVRQDIVSRTANQLTDEVHTNNRVFVVAENRDYGVHALNKEDIYRGDLPDDEIEQALKSAFERELRLFPMLQGLEDQLRGQLDNAGYEGAQEAGYSRDIFENIEASFKELFKDDAVVQNLEQAKLVMDEQIKEKAALLKNTKQVLNELGLSDNDVNTFLSQSPNLLPVLKNRLQKKIDDLPEDKKTSLESIKSSYLEKLTLFNNQAREELVSTADAFKARFFLTNEEGAATNINWPNVKEILWQRVQEQQYFEFTQGENVHLDALMNPNTSHEAFNSHLTAILNLLTPQDAIQALNHLHLPEALLEQTLLKYPEEHPEVDTYEFFKATLRFLDNPVIKDHLIASQHMSFIDAFKKDSDVLPLVVPFMTKESLAECLLGEALQDNRLHLEVLKKPQNIKPFMEVMEGHWPVLIKTTDDFLSVFYYLNTEQCTAVCKNLGEDLLNIIETVDDFWSVLYKLNAEQRTAVYESMKDDLPHIIQTTDDLKFVLYNLNPEQCTAVCKSLGDNLHHIIKTKDDFFTVFYELNAEQCIAVCKSLGSDLHHIIKTADDFFTVLYELNAEQRTAVYESMKDSLPHIIKTANDLALVLYIVDAEQYMAFFEDIKNDWSNLIKSEMDFENVVESLSEEQTKLVIENSAGLLHQAFLDDKLDFFEALIDRGVKLNDATISQICSTDNITLIQHLFDKNVVKPTEDMLSQACENGQVNMIRIIIPYLINDLDLPDSAVDDCVKAINKDNIGQLAQMGLHNFVLDQTKQHTSDAPSNPKLKTSHFKNRLNEITGKHATNTTSTTNKAEEQEHKDGPAPSK